MKLAIGSDHGGFELKQVVMELLREEGVDYTDMGPETGISGLSRIWAEGC